MNNSEEQVKEMLRIKENQLRITYGDCRNNNKRQLNEVLRIRDKTGRTFKTTWNKDKDSVTRKKTNIEKSKEKVLRIMEKIKIYRTYGGRTQHQRTD